jgi:hypothetical protein
LRLPEAARRNETTNMKHSMQSGITKSPADHIAIVMGASDRLLPSGALAGASNT